MISVLCIGHSFRYEMENVCRIFFPQEKFIPQQSEETDRVITLTKETVGTNATLIATVTLDGQTSQNQTTVAACDDFEKECERRLAVLLYQLLIKHCGFVPKWGILTGVRPVKLMHKLIDEVGEREAVSYFTDRLLVSAEKAQLCVTTAKMQDAIVAASAPESFSLYVSIPFCPTRCSYCSFVSQSIEKAQKLLPDYVEYLKRELIQTGAIAKSLGLRLETVYFGGGTPTTLSAEQLSELIATIETAFNLSTVREYTVEAGRPDTITKEKLLALKHGGVTRISINPQTMNDSVLEQIGRKHTAKQTLEAFDLARKVGFQNINMDTIAGLPKDTRESFARTFQILTDLDPESITVHTLALKRSSFLNHEEGLSLKEEAQQVDAMVTDSQNILSAHGYLPYYLYRQSKMLGNLENVGWTKPGFEGLYNVYIMEETHTILACGAGATTKLRFPGGEDIERIFNFKFPYEYMERFAEMQARKEGIVKFYERCK